MCNITNIFQTQLKVKIHIYIYICCYLLRNHVPQSVVHTATPLRCIDMVDGEIKEDTPKQPRIIVVDVCRVHVSNAIRALFSVRFPCARTAFVSQTCVAHLTDVGFMALVCQGSLAPKCDRRPPHTHPHQASRRGAYKTLRCGPVLKKKIVSWVDLSL